MIIFNFMAVPVVGAIIFICFAINNIAPALLDGRYMGSVISLVTLIVGAVAEFLGWKGRLFLIPIWLIGAVFLGFSLFSLWGWIGPFAIVPVLWLAVVGLLKRADALEAEAWAKAQRRVELLDDLAREEDRGVFWGCVKDCLLLPLGLKYTREIAAHQLRVMGPILAAPDTHFTKIERQSCHRMEQVLRDMERDPARNTVPMQLRREVMEAMGKIYTTFKV